MASIDRWEKDSFFSGAEELQESADRMESIYRRWIHAKEGYLWGLGFESALKRSPNKFWHYQVAGSSPFSANKTTLKVQDKDVGMEKIARGDQQLITECLKPSSQLVERGLGEAKEETFPGQRRTASANADISSWKIVVAADSSNRDSYDVLPDTSPRKYPVFQGF